MYLPGWATGGPFLARIPPLNARFPSYLSPGVLRTPATGDKGRTHYLAVMILVGRLCIIDYFAGKDCVHNLGVND